MVEPDREPVGVKVDFKLAPSIKLSQSGSQINCKSNGHPRIVLINKISTTKQAIGVYDGNQGDRKWLLNRLYEEKKGTIIEYQLDKTVYIQTVENKDDTKRCYIKIYKTYNADINELNHEPNIKIRCAKMVTR